MEVETQKPKSGRQEGSHPGQSWAPVGGQCWTPVDTYAVVFRLSRVDQYLERYGQAALNAALARLFRAATARFHAATSIAVLDSASIVMVGRNQSYDETRIEEFVNELGPEFPELSLVAGVFCNTDVSKAKTGHGELSALHAIDFARFAASDYAVGPSSRVAHFSYDVAHRILSSQRESRLFSQVQADFEKLRSLGVENARLCNLGGLAIAAQRNYEQAADLFERAVNLDNKNLIYKSNFATTAKTSGQIDRALRLLSGVNEEEVDSLRKLHPSGYFAYANLLASAKLESSPNFDAARFGRIAPLALTMEQARDSGDRENIERALAVGDV